VPPDADFVRPELRQSSNWDLKELK
jgi:hypothetical protein